MKLLYSFILLFSLIAKSEDSRKKIVVIDTGFNQRVYSTLPSNAICKNGLLDVTNTFSHDVTGHGTNVIGLIGQGINFNKYCIISIKYYNIETDVKKINEQAIKAVELAESFNPVLVNISSSGKDYLEKEKKAILRLLKKNTHVVVAAGNNGLNLSDFCLAYPACYNINKSNYHVIGFLDKLGKIHQKSNRHGPVTGYEYGVNQCFEEFCMTGTSQAAAKKSNSLIKLLK